MEVDETSKIMQAMDNNSTGLSITDIVRTTKISRSSVRISLARLEGAQRVKMRKIGMAKVYILNQQNIGKVGLKAIESESQITKS